MSVHPSYRPDRGPGETVASTWGQVASLPAGDARSAERRVVNLAADLRENGSSMVDVEIRDLSTDGFMMEGAIDVAPGAAIWLKLRGFAPLRSEVIWATDGRAGCRFATPLYPADLDLLVDSQAPRKLTRLFTPPERPVETDRPNEPPAEAA